MKAIISIVYCCGRLQYIQIRHHNAHDSLTLDVLSSQALAVTFYDNSVGPHHDDTDVTVILCADFNRPSQSSRWRQHCYSQPSAAAVVSSKTLEDSAWSVHRRRQIWAPLKTLCFSKYQHIWCIMEFVTTTRFTNRLLLTFTYFTQ